MSDRWKESSPGPLGDPGPDVELSAALGVVDPARGDPNYWLNFRDWVLRNAAPELARRRLMAELTVSDVMASWARAVVPTAVLAAALAGIILLRGEVTTADEPLRLEELLVAGLESPAAPADLVATEQESAVTFAEESF